MSVKIELIFVILFICKSTNSSNILGIFTSPSKSNYILYKSLLDELVERGHNVTIASTLRNPSENGEKLNYTYIYVQLNDEKNFSDFRNAALNKPGANSLTWKDIKALGQKYYSHALEFLRHQEIKKLKSEGKFDLVIIGHAINDFLVGIAAHFQCPSILITPNVANVVTNAYVRNPPSASYNPSIWLRYTHPMTLQQRIVNFLWHYLEQIIYFFVDHFVMEPLYNQEFPPDLYPSYSAAKDNVSLLLLANQFFTDSTPVATFPTQIYVGGMHLHSKRNPLPQDIQMFLDSAWDGAIYFSLGGNINSSNLPRETIDILVDEFAQLKQKILFKWEDNDTSFTKSKNMFISNWLPQIEVLNHSKTILFISHCGLGSVNEAKFFGVPLLCIPLMYDQFMNSRKVTEDGWGVSINFRNFTRSSFSHKLSELLSLKRYRLRAKEMSRLVRDEAMNPLDRAVYWVEYVIRHNGAKHLKSHGKNLNFFQYYSLDVIAFLSLVVYVVAKCSINVYRFCCHMKMGTLKVKVQ